MVESGSSRMSMAVPAAGSTAIAIWVNSSRASRIFVGRLFIDLPLGGKGGAPRPRSPTSVSGLLRSTTFLKLLKNFIHVEGGCNIDGGECGGPELAPERRTRTRG